ncbi:MAG: hypothetical protein E7313_07130 [Clostridiales bacterium]|nr:hypothetical protein [Clostridiales bacterium]
MKKNNFKELIKRLKNNEHETIIVNRERISTLEITVLMYMKYRYHKQVIFVDQKDNRSVKGNL